MDGISDGGWGDDSVTFDTTPLPSNDTLDGTDSQDDAAAQGYCGQDFKAFGDVYTRSIHGYTSLTVCVFGALANSLNLIVLTRKEMINPTNAILTGLALADLLNMVEYIPFAIYMNFLPASDGGQRKTYGWALFVLAHSNFAQVCHTISIWLTLTLAVWRYIMVAMPMRCKTLCTMDRAKWAICSAYLASPLLCFPIYFTFAIKAITPKAAAEAANSTVAISTTVATTTAEFLNATSNSTTLRPPSEEDLKYIVHYSDLAIRNPFLMNTNFWLYSVVIKLIPCIMLTVVSLRLINSLMEAKKRKEKLMANKRTPGGNQAASPAGGGMAGARNNTRGGDESGGSDRTTRMLLAVLLLFLITEFPQGLLSLLTGLLGDAFFKSCYIPLADLMDFVALLNSAINFILYCSMSKKFRDTFSQVFGLDELAKMRQRRRQASINNHIASPSANRHLLGNFNGKEQTAV